MESGQCLVLKSHMHMHKPQAESVQYTFPPWSPTFQVCIYIMNACTSKQHVTSTQSVRNHAFTLTHLIMLKCSRSRGPHVRAPSGLCHLRSSSSFGRNAGDDALGVGALVWLCLHASVRQLGNVEGALPRPVTGHAISTAVRQA